MTRATSQDASPSRAPGTASMAATGAEPELGVLTPELLERSVPVTTRGHWLLLAALGLIVLAALAWAITGRSERVTVLEGVYAPSPDRPTEVALVVPGLEAGLIREGAAAWVRPLALSRVLSGSVVGEVVMVAPGAMSRRELAEVLGDPDWAERVAREVSAPTRVIVRLERDAATGSMRWIGPRGAEGSLRPGSRVRAEVRAREAGVWTWIWSGKIP